MKGTRLGVYEILDKLGEGGMGQVWRAHDEQLDRIVAVKVLHPEISSDPGRRARFEQEARALGALNHPNVVAVYGAGQHEGRSYLVSELVEGEPLRSLIDRGRVPLRKLIDIAVQIADAVAAAHAVGIVHRDLKPENIMITPAGRVKVLDFGLAKQKAPTVGDNSATLALSQPGVAMGTAGYMSPEQVRGESVDHRSDIFSFGVVLYEMAAGKRAFNQPSAVETMNAILHEDPPELEADTPAALTTIIRRCLEKRPEQRFQSAADLAFALRAIAPTSVSGAQTALRQIPVAAARRRWWLPVAAILGGIALFGAGFLLRDRTISRALPRFQRVTFRSGLVTNARFTPDGRGVVYTAKWDGGPPRVYLATPGSPDSRDLQLPDETLVLAVSSKEEIAFLSGPFAPDGSGTLSRMSISGGQMRPALEGVTNADWSPDGNSIAVLRAFEGRFRLEYPIGKVLMTGLDYPLMAMRVSPDGKRVACVYYYEGSSLAIIVVDRDGEHKKRMLAVVSDQTPNRIDPSICWSPDGKEIWYRSFDPKEWGTVYALDMKGRRRVVASVPGHATLYDIASDGRMLLRTDNRQVGILGIAPGETAERDLSCLDSSPLLGISEDGRAIAATVVGEGGGARGSVYLRKTDGSSAIRLGDGSAWAFSPDGKWVSAYTSTNQLTRRYFLLPTGAGEEREIAIPQLKPVNLVFGWGRDDDTLYVMSQGKAKKLYQYYAWNSRSGALRTIGPEGVRDGIPLVSPDRNWVLTYGPDGRSWVYPVDKGAAQAVMGLTPHDVPVGWRADNKSLYIVTHHDENRMIPVSVLDIATGQRTPWKEIRPARPVEQAAGVRITPDGRAYAYNFIVKTSDLYVVEGAR